MKKTTKKCPRCGSTELALFHSSNTKLCTVCHLEFLDEGQKPLFGSRNWIIKFIEAWKEDISVKEKRCLWNVEIEG